VTTKAIILAAGLGTRMRRADGSAALDAAQQRVADDGVKGMIPVGRPFLDYAINALADAGIADVCLVIGASSEHQRVRDHYTAIPTDRVRIHFATQREPRGTADAVLAGESFASGEHVLAVNSDNYYPVDTLRALRELGSAGVSVFEREALVRLGNIPAERVSQWAVVKIDRDGMLERIVEKPDAKTIALFGDTVYVGMNSWSLPPEIYDACRRITASPRGELELQDAVQYARDRMDVRFRVLIHHDGVLDLSTRGDVASVAERLRGVAVRL
jgi:dTDP-glucose pyrophosphorylase